MSDTGELFAWIGEDELGSGVVGIKQALTPAGCIPLVSLAREKVTRAAIVLQLQRQADLFGKPIRLARFRYVEDVTVIMPKEK